MIRYADRVLEVTVFGALRETKTSPPLAHATVRLGRVGLGRVPVLRVTQLCALIVASLAQDEWERVKELGDAAFAVYAEERSR